MSPTRKKILEIARALPPGPRVFSELDGMIRDPNHSLDAIASLVKRDSTLAAHLVRVGNGVVYGGETKIGSVEEALGRIGLDEVFRIVGEVASVRLVERSLLHYGIEADALREHMLHTAFISESLAIQCGLDPRHAYTAGLMRPLGMLVADRLAEGFAGVADYHPTRDRDYLEWEARVFGISSCEIAAMVLEEWGFPPSMIEGIRSQYLLRSADLKYPFACLLNLASGVVAQDDHGLLGEADHWGSREWKLEAIGLDEVSLLVAATRGREAYAGFCRRVQNGVSGPSPKPHGSPSVAAAAAVLEDRLSSADAEAGEEAAPRGGAGVVVVAPRPQQPRVGEVSCNLKGGSGVLPANDEPPVHSHETGVSPAPDFTTFMRNYQDMVFSTAARLTNNDAQAEDIAQEVFLKAYENFHHLRTSPTAGGWLKTVATNLSLNHLSRYRKRWRFFSEFKRDDAADDHDAPEVEFAAPDAFFDHVDAEERRALVADALAQLPEHHRVPLVLYHFEDMPYDEIARRLGVSLAKVKTDILRARAALVKVFQRSGTAHEKISL